MKMIKSFNLKMITLHLTNFIKPLSFWLILVFSVFLLSCQNDLKLKSNKIWDVKTGESNFSLALTQKQSGKIIELAGKDQSSAFYYITKSGKQNLTSQSAVISNTDSVYKVSYKTTDNRKVIIFIQLTPSGILNVSFSVDPKEGIEKTGICIKTKPEEHFYGLMERTVDGDQKKSWDPETVADLNLRGQKVTMLVTPTLGIFEPFYTSSEGYGMFVHGDHQGVYDMAATDDSLVQITFDNDQLKMSVVPGPGVADVVKKLPVLTGKSFLPPLWAFKPHYDTGLIATYRLYSIIHNDLAEYSHRMAKKAVDTGMPIVRPLSLIYPDDKKAVEHWDEYMYGDNILVGIIWKDNQKSFDMYLPEGNWVYYWTGKTYTGNKTVRIDCPEYKIPIFFTGNDRPKLSDPNRIYKASLKLAQKKPDLKKLQKEERWKLPCDTNKQIRSIRTG